VPAAPHFSLETAYHVDIQNDLRNENNNELQASEIDPLMGVDSTLSSGPDLSYTITPISIVSVL
jgi:hypothetical protein